MFSKVAAIAWEGQLPEEGLAQPGLHVDKSSTQTHLPTISLAIHSLPMAMTFTLLTLRTIVHQWEKWLSVKYLSQDHSAWVVGLACVQHWDPSPDLSTADCDPARGLTRPRRVHSLPLVLFPWHPIAVPLASCGEQTGISNSAAVPNCQLLSHA